MLSNKKNPKSETKILIFRFNQKSLNHFNMIIQQIIAFSILGFAVFYLIKKFFFKKKSDKNCGSNGCGCD